MNNLRADYEKEYPSDTQQDVYLKEYILATNPDWKLKLLRDVHISKLFFWVSICSIIAIFRLVFKVYSFGLKFSYIAKSSFSNSEKKLENWKMI